jgi:hypothetical protein
MRWILLLVLAGLCVAGCKTDQGSREYVPNKGWVPVK